LKSGEINMAEIIKETVITQESDTDTVVETPVKVKATNTETYEYIVYFFFGTLELLLAFRLVLKLMGASLSSAFVGFIYGLTGLFILPFEGIFHRGLSQGIETTSVLEPATLVALIVYAFLAWGIVKLIRISSGEKQTS
jgi:YGGT family